MKHEVLFLAISCFVQAAHADVILPKNEDPIKSYSWTGGPSLIKGSEGCATANVCVGAYKAYPRHKPHLEYSIL